MFEMQSNMVVTASFVPNPFLSVRGRYSGLFLNTNITHQNSGFFTLMLSSNGAFSASMVFNGATNRFSGSFDNAGRERIGVLRGNTVIIADMQLSFRDKWIFGTVSDETWSSDLAACLAPFTLSNPATNFAGKYTMMISSSLGLAAKLMGPPPPVYSYGLGNVSTAGIILMSGSLADGTPMSQSVGVSADGLWPLYAPLYGGRGVIMGWLTFNGYPVNNLGGSVTWIKPAIPEAVFYKRGFTNSSSATGSSFHPVPAGVRVLSFANGYSYFTGGNLPTNETSLVKNSTNNVITSSSLTDPAKVRLTIDRTSGLMRGSFLNTATRKTNIVSGVVLQYYNQAFGYFRGTNQAGAAWVGEPSR
jgi:hypothetical protein